MLNFFRAKSDRHKRYKELFDKWERFLLTHQDDVFVVSQTATQTAMLAFEPIATSYGIPVVHNSEALLKFVRFDDLRSMSEACFAKAEHYRSKDTERFYQGAILAGLYFGVAGLMAEKERSISDLWRRVEDAMSSSVGLSAKPASAWSASKGQTEGKGNPGSKAMHPKTAEALAQVKMSKARYEQIGQLRHQEIDALDENFRELFDEQKRLFAEIERLSEDTSPSMIYGASISVMNLFERTISRRGHPMRLAEPEIAAAGMMKFIDWLYNATDIELSRIETLSHSLCSKVQSNTSLLGAKVTRVIVLGRFLSFHLVKIAPLCAHEAQWLATTLLSDLEKLSALEIGDHS